MDQLKSNEAEITLYDDESIDLDFGAGISPEAEETILKSFIDAGYEEVTAKSEHKKKVVKKRRWIESVPKYVNDKDDNGVDDSLEKDDSDLPYWHPKAQMAHAKRQRAMETAERRAKVMGPQPAPRPMPNADMLAGGTGKKYANIPDIKPPKTPNTTKSEEVVKFNDGGQWSIEKSNYGPKGAKLYNEADNARRKANNTDTVDLGNMSRVKEYGAADPRRQQSEARRLRSLNRKQPVKVYTPEEIKAFEAKRQQETKKSMPDWSSEEQMLKSAPRVQLQATDEQLFGAGVVTQEQADAAKAGWENTINNWHTEVSKPVESGNFVKSWGSRGPIHKEKLTEEEERIRQIPVDPRLMETD